MLYYFTTLQQAQQTDENNDMSFPDIGRPFTKLK